MLKFPQNFLWGAATSSYQVEGNNRYCDWWEWEKRVGLKDLSGEACRHYELYAQDFDLARQLHHNTHRLSLEWSRIEPQENNFQKNEITHYLQVIKALRDRKLEPVVTLHHFTNPLWFSEKGAWEDPKLVDYFLRFVKYVVGELAGEVRFWITINEPLVLAYHAYLLDAWPPQKKSLSTTLKVGNNLASAHIEAYRIIHEIYKEKNLPAPMVSVAKNMQYFMPRAPTLKNIIGVMLRNKSFNFDFLDKLVKKNTLDYIGLNYYTRSLIDVKKWDFNEFLTATCKDDPHPLKKNSLGWDIYPEGLYKLLMELKKYNLPVLITENGICTDDDALRWEYIRAHLEKIHQALGEGAKVIGYLYWSLLDNFEWDKGFDPRFGLIEMDYATYGRRVRESAQKLAKVCQTGTLE